MKSEPAADSHLDSLITKFRRPNPTVRVYLNTAAESLYFEPHISAFETYADCKSSGSEGRPLLTRLEDETRSLVSEMINVPTSDVIFLSNTSRCLDVAIKSITWQAGDNIVFSETEFLTTEFTGALLSKHGVEVRVVPSDRGVVELDQYASRIDARTKLVVASSVSYKTGMILDIKGLSKITRASGTLLFVDGIQGLGSVPIDASFADFFAAGTFKWMFGMHGVAIFSVRADVLRQLGIPYVGYHSVSEMFGEDRTSTFDLWPDARRFQEGLPNYAGILVLRSSLLAIKSVGIEAISSKNQALMRLLIEELLSMGIRPFGFDKPDQHAPIVAFESDDFSRIGTTLRDRGVVSWAKDGRVRFSPHFYNSEDDILECISALRSSL